MLQAFNHSATTPVTRNVYHLPTNGLLLTNKQKIIDPSSKVVLLGRERPQRETLPPTSSIIDNQIV